MSLTYEQIAAEALKLAPDERLHLAEKLWGSVETPESVAQAWEGEIRRRLEEIDAGAVELLDGDEVIAELRSRLQ